MNALRDQLRARHAYASVTAVPSRDRDDYRIAVNSFGSHVIRTGLCAAIAWLQRDGRDASHLFLEHLDKADIRGLAAAPGGKPFATFADKAHAADAANYMIATRDTLALVVWFRRAVQALRGADRQDDAR